MPSCFSRICQDELRTSSYITQQYETSFVASTKKGQKKEIIVNVLNANGQMVPIRAVMDSGNDITILTTATARQLGLYHPNRGEKISVSGIAGGGQEFNVFPNWIQFGNMRPIQIKMGFALRDESLPVNLIGNKDIIDSGQYVLTMDEDSIELREKMPMANMGDRFGGGSLPTQMVNYYTRRGYY
jgi:hypothetical protein